MSDSMSQHCPNCEAQAAEIERLTKASDGDVGLMHWQGEKIERLEAEIERLRAVLELADAALRGANVNMNVLERKIAKALEGKAEQ